MGFFAGAVLSASLLTAQATPGYDIAARMSPKALDTVAQWLPSFFPDVMRLPEINFELGTCVGTGDLIGWTQKRTDIALTFTGITMTVPSPDVVRIEATGRVLVDGDAFIENFDSCTGAETCQETLNISQVDAVLELAVNFTPENTVELTTQTFEITPVTVDEIQFSNCSLATAGTAAIDLGREAFFNFIIDFLRDLFVDELAPLLSDVLTGFIGIDGSADFAFITAGIKEANFAADGATFRAELDFKNEVYAPADCIDDPLTEPQPQPQQVQDLSAFNERDIAFAFELGVINDALYHIWHTGLLCITDVDARSLGVPVDLGPVAAILPGFPTGTEFSFEIHFDNPPSVRPLATNNVRLDLNTGLAHLMLTGAPPEGPERTVTFSFEATASMSMRIDAGSNLLMVRAEDVVINQLDIAGLPGFDAERFSEVVAKEVIAPMLKQFGEMPIFSPVAGLSDFFILPVDLFTTETHLIASADMVLPPKFDSVPPQTIVLSDPNASYRPGAARLQFSGIDTGNPPQEGEVEQYTREQLLRFAVTVDGDMRAPNFSQEISLGVIGETHTYNIEVAAVDLNDNTDPTPEVFQITVDGVPPLLVVEGESLRHVSADDALLSWSASDDLTPAGEISYILRLFRFADDANMMSATLVNERALAIGATEFALQLEDGETYKAILIAADKAGNQTAQQVILIAKPAPGGCTQTPPMALAALLVMLGILRNRRGINYGA